MHNLEMANKAMGLDNSGCFVSWLPLYHDMGLIGGMLQPFYAGFPCVLIPPELFMQKPLTWLQAISKYKATVSGGPDFSYEYCASNINSKDLNGLDLSAWEVAFNGAEPIRVETLRRFAEKFSTIGFRDQAFYPCYGMAEATLLITGGTRYRKPSTTLVDAAALKKHKIRSPEEGAVTQEFVSCGWPWLGQKIAIVDPGSAKRCQEGEVGEIWVTGPSVAKGYWNKFEESAKTFQATIYDEDDDAYLRTGDLGFIKNNELYVTGRLKDLVIVRGRNHYPQDIEATVANSHQALSPQGAAAFSVVVAGQEQLVVVHEVKRSYLRNLDPKGISSAIRRCIIEEHDLPLYGIALLRPGRLPKTTSGKIQRSVCKETYLNGRLDEIWRAQFAIPGDYESPEPISTAEILFTGQQSDIVTWLQIKLSNKLRVPISDIEKESGFETYSIDSVILMQLTQELEIFVNRKLSPDIFWQYQNIEDLAQGILKQNYQNTEPMPIPEILPDAAGSGSEFPINEIQQAYMLG